MLHKHEELGSCCGITLLCFVNTYYSHWLGIKLIWPRVMWESQIENTERKQGRVREEPAARKQDARGQVKPCGKIQINTNGLIYIVRAS